MLIRTRFVHIQVEDEPGDHKQLYGMPISEQHPSSLFLGAFHFPGSLLVTPPARNHPVSWTVLSLGTKQQEGGRERENVNTAVFGSAFLELHLHQIERNVPFPESWFLQFLLLATVCRCYPCRGTDGTEKGVENTQSLSLRSFLFCSLGQIQRVPLGSRSSPQRSRPSSKPC